MTDETMRTEPQLAALSELPEHRVAEGNPDIRGWVVEGVDGGRLGSVRELLVDMRAMKARYMVIQLAGGLPGVQLARDVLVPLSRARLDDATDRVYLDDVTVATAHTLPRYERRDLTPERSVANSGVGQPEQSDDQSRFFGQRRSPDAGPYVVVVRTTETEVVMAPPARTKEEV